MTDLPWEDNLLERKVNPSLKDLIKTIVAFANSVKPEHKATLLIGEEDDGTVRGVGNPEKMQMAVREACDKIYPPITNTCKSKVYKKDGKDCVRVEIEYDGETPHFGGKAWIRQGSQSKEASKEVFQKLIELRLGKVRELEKWIDKDITIEPDPQALVSPGFKDLLPVKDRFNTKLLNVNNFWITFSGKVERHNMSIPLEKIILNWDDQHNRLMLYIKP